MYDEENLKLKLGPFYKRPLPQRTDMSLDLRLLGMMEWMESVESGSKYEFSPVVQTMVSNFNQNSSWILLGPSGCGKTRAIFDVATQHPVIFFNCVPSDSYFTVACEDKNYPNLFDECQKLLHSQKPEPSAASDLIEPLIFKQLVCRMLLLVSLLSSDELYSPANFLLLQLNGGQDMIV